jgi:hypothetical protein
METMDRNGKRGAIVDRESSRRVFLASIEIRMYMLSYNYSGK